MGRKNFGVSNRLGEKLLRGVYGRDCYSSTPPSFLPPFTTHTPTPTPHLWGRDLGVHIGVHRSDFGVHIGV